MVVDGGDGGGGGCDDSVDDSLVCSAEFSGSWHPSWEQQANISQPSLLSVQLSKRFTQS